MNRCGNCIHSIKTMRLLRTPFDSEYDAFGIPNSVVRSKKIQWRCTVDPGKWRDVEEDNVCESFILDSLQEFLEPDLDKFNSKRGER